MQALFLCLMYFFICLYLQIMKISLNWLLKYIPELKVNSIDEFLKRIIETGFDIESVENQREIYSNIITGEVIEKLKHPDADKLSHCKVSDGKKEYSVVCGAPNVEAGQKICFAKIGARIPNGDFEIKKNKIRGIVSEGMICSEKELNLSDDHSRILVLDVKTPPGIEFADYIGANDFFIEIGITPNRGDLLSHFGIAREVASAFGLNFVKPEIDLKETDVETKELITIEIQNKEYCKRFTGRVIRGVKVGESPLWLKERLNSVGLRPRNNIVDITNFILMETGQPLHAFDYDKISGKKLIIKTANENEKFTTLDSKERTLNKNSLMIYDSEKASSIAGIMGGEYSEITDNTTNVFLESAYFDPVCIRRNSKRLMLSTDASQRFERGVDIDNVIYSSDRAAQLIVEIAGGKVSKNVIDIYPEKFDKLSTFLRIERVEKILGKKITELQCVGLLESIGFIKKEKVGSKIYFEVPEYRRLDVFREIDLIEEIARLHGYDNFENQEKYSGILSTHIKYDDEYLKFVNETKNHFIGRGFSEIITYSQQDEKKVKLFSEGFINLENPNSVEMNVMRINLIYGMLNTIKSNFNNSGKDISLKLFETGKVFFKGVNGFSEKEMLCFAISGKNDKKSFDEKENRFDVYDFKGEFEIYKSKLNLENLEYIYYYANGNGKIAEVLLNKEVIGTLSKYSDTVEEFVEKETEVFVAEFDLRRLYNSRNLNRHYTEISKYPAVKRDIALLAEKKVRYTDIESCIKKNGGRVLKSLYLFDLYEDKKIGEGKKSLAISLEFNSNEKTLTDDEVNRQLNKIVKDLEKEYGIILRS